MCVFGRLLADLCTPTTALLDHGKSVEHTSDGAVQTRLATCLFVGTPRHSATRLSDNKGNQSVFQDAAAASE